MLLRNSLPILAGSLTAVSAYIGCDNCTNESTEPYKLAPAPWNLTGTIYTAFLLPGLGVSLDGDLPKKAFPPLEREHSDPAKGDFVGLIGTIQVVRYTDSPVGPYDEMFIIPGFFDYEVNGQTERNLRVSRIYVSQKYCVWNARKSKYMATFAISDQEHSTLKIVSFASSVESTQTSRPLRLDLKHRRQRICQSLPIRHNRRLVRILPVVETVVPDDILLPPT